ncbi:MAG TPA: tripartite tricarboxylate transporter substrate binding protein, partial [Burkholderiales bacterium]|nr:tripartite tricarboxylate transporter substrate binding protein [Burkholderiales bacterium]
AIAVAMALATTLLHHGDAWSQTYPTKPVRLIVPFPAGGGTDIFARLVGRKMGDNMGQTFVVDNRAGASGIIGCEVVAKSAPDGYTLLMGTTGTHTTNPAVFSKLPYDPLKDFTPISLVAESPFVLLVHPSLPVRSVKDLIAFARMRPGQLTYASSGTGSSSHLGFELVNLMAGRKGVHVPYKGLPPAMLDTISGYVTMTWNSITASAPYIRNKQVRALGIGSAKRSALMPEIPTISESGLTGFELGSWYGLFAPAGTSPEIVRRIRSEVVKAINDSGLKEQFVALSAEPIGSTSAEFAKVLRRDLAKWAKVARQANVKAD